MTAAEVADILFKVYLLSKAANKRIAFAWQPFAQSKSNPGWAVARALCRVRRGQRTAAHDRVDLAAHRWLLLRAEDLDLRLARSLSGLSFGPMLWLIGDLAERYLEAPQSPRLDRVAARLLQRALRSVGIAVHE